jgi:DNA-binding IclR family transcriptional regulator
MAESSKTVDQAVALLFEIRRGGAGNATDLARRCDMSRQSVLRALAALEPHGLIRRQGMLYRLGAGLVELASGLEPDLRADARPILAELVREFGETAVLTIRQGNLAVPVEQVTAPDRLVRIQYRPGQAHPLALTAHGRCLLVGLRPAELSNLGIDPDRVAGELFRLEELGYLSSRDELEEGASGLAAPVRAPDGRAVASLGIVAPTNRFPDERSVARSVRRAAADVSRTHFGHSRSA